MTILEEAQLILHRSPWFRLGQAVYNIAHSRNPLVRHLSGTALDPFYHDDRIEAFLARIKELWGVQ